MRRLAWTLCGMLVATASLLSASFPNRGTSVIEMLVQRGDGSFVTMAGTTDLQVRVGDASASVERVEPADGPVSVALLVDVSLSAATTSPVRLPDPWDDKGMVAAIDREFAKRLPAGDRARVGWFTGTTIRLDDEFRSDRSDLAAVIRKLLFYQRPSPADAFGPSPMVDVVSSVAGSLRAEPGRRAIFLISDGESSGNLLSLEDAARRASATGVPVHAMLDAPAQQERAMSPVGSGTEVRYPPKFDRGRLLSKLASLTGGVYSRDERFAHSSWGFSTPKPPFDYFFTAMHSTLRVTLSGPTVTPGAPIEITAKDTKWVVSAPHWVPDAP
jgi:hypothetical protein